MNKEKRASQFGRSMVEMLGVLAIIGVLSVGGIVGYTKAMEKYKINQTIDEVNTVISNIQTTFYGKHEILYCASYNNDKCIGLRAAGIAPDEMWTSGNYMKLSHFGPLSINVNDNILYVTLNGLSKTACVTLATLDWNRNDRGLIAVNAKGYMDGDGCDVGDCYESNGQRTCGDDDDGWTAVCAKDAPMPMTTAVRGCTCTDSDCEIILGFKI